ncbi:MAG: hypothetical protein ABIA62_00020 [Candidatus Woesearchaeota archaeon]
MPRISPTLALFLMMLEAARPAGSQAPSIVDISPMLQDRPVSEKPIEQGLPINYNGLQMELEFQDWFAEYDKDREGSTLIVLGDPAEGTSLYIGRIDLAAETIAEKVTGNVEIKTFYSADDLVDYIANTDLTFKNIIWYGHGDAQSFWMDLTHGSDEPIFDEGFLERLVEYSHKFTDDLLLKAYTCHGAADRVPKPNMGELIHAYLDADVFIANSWVFARGIPDGNGGVNVYYYPATRTDYSVEFDGDSKMGSWDCAYTGESQWVFFGDEEVRVSYKTNHQSSS